MKKAGKICFPAYFARLSVAICKVVTERARYFFTISRSSTSNFSTLFGLICGPAWRSP